MKELRPSLKRIVQPYLFISFAGLFAFAPVSLMLRALKNDIIALEYPINHFMSQCIRNGELPYWFNTWGMGFPLQSNLTWGIFSTPQMLFSSLFNYNIYVLHIEFMFFVLLAGWSMFHLLHTYLVKDKNISQLLAICYMLSGFIVGSTQWLLYITAASLIPLVISSLLKLLYSPSFKSALQFAIVYTIMFTSVYAAFNIITTYSLLIFLLLWFLLSESGKRTKLIALRFLAVAGVMTSLLCFPPLYFTLELLKQLERGAPIATDAAFFNSNYLHPSALSSMLLPFSSVKMNYSNTEGTMLNTYMGLFVVLILPVATWHAMKERNRSALLMLGAALLFLLISFGNITPLRNALNLLPGFSYFRNPAIFRFYFILSLILFLSIIFRNKSFSKLIDFKEKSNPKLIQYTAWILLIICLITFFTNLKEPGSLSTDSLAELIKNISFSQAIVISASIQLIILFSLLLAAKARRFTFAKLVLTADLIINTLLCTPFFSVSSYSIPEVARILHSSHGFPLQNTKLNAVPAIYTDNKMNTWNNVNIFNKEVSSNNSYRGPLTLNGFYLNSADSIQRAAMFNNPLVFPQNDSAAASIKLLLQKPTHIRIAVNFNDSNPVTVMQNYYPGWNAWYNDKKIEITTGNKPGMAIAVTKGEGIIDFRYERKSVWLSAMALHLIIISFLFWKLSVLLKRILSKSFSPS